MYARSFVALLFAALTTGVSFAQEVHPAHGAVPLYDNLGSHHYAVTTSVPEAQAYFDQGLRLYYAFNHEEAIRAFDAATRIDPECGLCPWGTALAYGPNINLPMDAAAGAAAWDAIQEARSRREYASERERALIDALAARYVAEPTDDRVHLDQAWADALRGVASKYPDDPEAATLLAESLMDLSPWNYWRANGSPGPNTVELLGQLERVLEANPDHPGANHLYIHAVEAVDPERAVAQAERLAGLMPGAGHIVHMPGHIYIRVGRYLDAIRANEHAVHADETYIRDNNPAQGVYVGGYYPHNYDFLSFAASMIGREEQTISSAEKITEVTPIELARTPGTTFIQHYRTRHLQMKVRFGRWDDILKGEVAPEDLVHERAMWHYARGRAHLGQNRPAQARVELDALRGAVRAADEAGLRLEFNSSVAVLSIAEAVLSGFVAEAEADVDRAVADLRHAAALEDALTYGEPPEWSVPVRQELGFLLLRAGRASEAEEAFRSDLRRFPDNGWSLHGLARSLEDQNRKEGAASARSRYDEVWEGRRLTG